MTWVELWRVFSWLSIRKQMVRLENIQKNNTYYKLEQIYLLCLFMFTYVMRLIIEELLVFIAFFVYTILKLNSRYQYHYLYNLGLEVRAWRSTSAVNWHLLSDVTSLDWQGCNKSSSEWADFVRICYQLKAIIEKKGKKH